MKSSFRLFRIAGIEIGIHFSWIFIFLLIAWSLAQGFFPQSHPDWSVSTYWIMGVAAALLLFVSVLLHELAHSLVAKSRGLPVDSITLFLLGGVSNLGKEPEKPQVEFYMAIVGPGTSLVLAVIFWTLLQIIIDKTGPLAGLLYYLALINILLAAFNILPGFPLDGGRVLRSIIWGATGNLEKATNIATTVGRVIGWLLIASGIFWIFRGDFFGGLWIVFIGWFLNSSAQASRQEISLRTHLSGIKIKQLIYGQPEFTNSGATVESIVHNVFHQGKSRAIPVVENEKLAGIVTVTDVKGLPHDKWSSTPVGDIMTRSPLYSVSPEDDLNTALSMIAGHDINQVIVLDNGKLVGLISRADIIRHIQLSQELNLKR